MNCANHPDRERVSFCQNCGKPLCAECARTIGTGVFCEPCLVARLAAADATSGAASAGYAAVPVAGVPPVSPGSNPLVAGALGFIPGVGAMYNGQYAKGVVHLIIFVVLVSLADTYNPLGMLVAGWIFYQVFEAYHTARARRTGMPLPNPFGLNDVGERLGFGRTWTAPVPPVAGPSGQYTSTTASAVPPYTPPFTQAAGGGTGFRGGDGVPFQQEPRPWGASVPVAGNAASAGANWGAPQDGYAPVPPFASAGAAGYGEPYAAPLPYASPLVDVPPGGSRFPAGAIWLIALGLLFFFGSSGLLRHFPIQRLLPLLLIGLGVWLFLRKMTGAGQGLGDDGGQNYRLRVFRALRGPVWIVLVGVLFFLDTFNLLSWGRSWPLFIIVAGLMTFFERSTYPLAGSAAAAGPAYGTPGMGTRPVQEAAAVDGEGTAVARYVAPYGTHETTSGNTQDRTHDQEGS